MISPQRKNRIRRQANRAARQETAPQRQAIRNERRAIRGSARREIRSARGASQMLQRALSQAIGSADESGLKGRYLKDVVAELSAQKGDAAAMVPFARSQVNMEKREALAGLSADAQLLRANQAQSAREALESKLQAVAEAKRTRVKERSEAAKEHTGIVKNTSIVLQNLLADEKAFAESALPPLPADATAAQQAAAQKAEAAKVQSQAFLRDINAGDPNALSHAAAAVASKAEGVDQAMALQIIRRILGAPKPAVGGAISGVGGALGG